MEINLNQPLAPLPKLKGTEVSAPKKKAATDAAEFPQTEALNRALAKTEDVRPEVVARGKQLVADANYPPREMIRRIAHLLASNLGDES